METKRISVPLLMRLPGYLDYLHSLSEEDNATVSATAIATALGLGDVMVRKDLALVSNGGKRRVGHQRDQLIQDIEAFLDRNNVSNAVLVGAGKLGQALMSFEEFKEQGLNILAAFDKELAQDMGNCPKPIYSMDQLEAFCYRNRVRIGIITVPATYAQEVCDRRVDYGIEAIWNFASVNLNVPEHILVQSINLAASLSVLRMQQIKQRRTPSSDTLS